jgi:hypothetical protein
MISRQSLHTPVLGHVSCILVEHWTAPKEMESLVSHGEQMRLCLQRKFQFVYLKLSDVLCIGPQLKQVFVWYV